MIYEQLGQLPKKTAINFYQLNFHCNCKTYVSILDLKSFLYLILYLQKWPFFDREIVKLHNINVNTNFMQIFVTRVTKVLKELHVLEFYLNQFLICMQVY